MGGTDRWIYDRQMNIYSLWSLSIRPVRLSVCLSVCLSVPYVHCHDTNACSVSSIFNMDSTSLPVSLTEVHCPVSDCTFEGSLKRVLAHFRLSHRLQPAAGECPIEFIEENNIEQCLKCCQWFMRLQQHSWKCLKSQKSGPCSALLGVPDHWMRGARSFCTQQDGPSGLPNL